MGREPFRAHPSRASSLTTVEVLPVPGPPETMVSRDSAASMHSGALRVAVGANSRRKAGPARSGSTSTGVARASRATRDDPLVLVVAPQIQAPILREHQRPRLVRRLGADQGRGRESVRPLRPLGETPAIDGGTVGVDHRRTRKRRDDPRTRGPRGLGGWPTPPPSSTSGATGSARARQHARKLDVQRGEHAAQAQEVECLRSRSPPRASASESPSTSRRLGRSKYTPR